ncbi:mammalian cell entry protein [Mycolicibacterium goodii]|uniref:mammalian cell entry protein n=1 Tax=Mycolicibacterium goodii TaxID=134601 RepID=UPI001BDC8514|nr:mammalian cell entry protein [Mycolicibacterium goodii]MBU8810713.1 mammalian cell entry protein [Mycolicibacterium goodii]
MEDQPADSGDLTTGTPARRRRWGFPLRRRQTEPAEQSASTDADSADAGTEPSPEVPEKPRPVGKRRRTAVSATSDEETSGTEDATEPEVDAPEEETSASTPTVEEPAAEGTAEAEPVVETELAEETESTDPAHPTENIVFVPFRPAGKGLTYAAVAAATLFVAAGAFAGAMVWPYLSDRALVDTKFQVAQTSADAITTLWTYTPDNIDTLPDRASRYLSNDFADEYRKFIDSIVPSNKQAQITNNTQVVGTAVESINANEATAIVYTNSVSTSPVTKNVPSLRYLSYRLTLERSDGDWRITQMPALTQLDLSPQL